jgi:hypothetical protein
MKKVLLLAVAGVFVLASCAKDRTCECTSNGVTEKGVTYKKVTKAFMQTEANCVSTEYTKDNKTYKTECEIL